MINKISTLQNDIELKPMKPNVKFEEVKIVDTNGVWARIFYGREITIPTAWFKRLAGATPEKLNPNTNHKHIVDLISIANPVAHGFLEF